MICIKGPGLRGVRLSGVRLQAIWAGPIVDDMPDDARRLEGLRETAIPGKPVVDPAVWTGAEMAARGDWIYELSAADIASLSEMVKTVRAEIGDDPNGLLPLRREELDLGDFAQPMAEIYRQIEDGRGFQLIRGLPVGIWKPLDLAVAYWAMGLNIGTPVANNPEGDMLGHVVDLGKDYENPAHRGYQTSAHMLFHSDQCDVVTLLCLRTSKSGGASKIVSSLAVHNEMVRRRPDLAAELGREFYWTKHGEVPEGDHPWYRLSVFNYCEGFLSVVGGQNHIRKGHALPGVPPLTAAQLEALQVMADINEELHLSMTFLPGDIQILNNHVTTHSRTAFEDWPEPERRRKLWRLWLRNEALRPRAAGFAERVSGICGLATRPQVVL